MFCALFVQQSESNRNEPLHMIGRIALWREEGEGVPSRAAAQAAEAAAAGRRSKKIKWRGAGDGRPGGDGRRPKFLPSCGRGGLDAGRESWGVGSEGRAKPKRGEAAGGILSVGWLWRGGEGEKAARHKAAAAHNHTHTHTDWGTGSSGGAAARTLACGGGGRGGTQLREPRGARHSGAAEAV